MSSLEQAIRNALEKAGPEADAAQRAHIYQSARNALENGLRKQNVSAPAVISAQREQLEGIIHKVEREALLDQMEREAQEKRVRDQERAARIEQRMEPKADEHPEPTWLSVQSEPEMDFPPKHDPQSQHKDAGPEPELVLEDEEPRFEPSSSFELGAADERMAPRHSAASHSSPAPKPSQRPATVEINDIPARTAAKPRKVRRWKAKLFVFATFAAFVATGWLWVQSSGLLLTFEQRDGSVPNPPPSATGEDFDGAKQLKSLSRQGGYSDDWTKLFDAAESPNFEKGPDVTASIKTGGSGSYLDMVSSSVDAAGAITIAIPQDLIARMQGHSSNIALTLQGEEKPVQVAVECDFGGLGNCGRHRFVLSNNKSDLLFDVTVKADGQAQGPGKLIINPDAGGTSSAAKLYAIHILPSS